MLTTTTPVQTNAPIEIVWASQEFHGLLVEAEAPATAGSMEHVVLIEFF